MVDSADQCSQLSLVIFMIQFLMETKTRLTRQREYDAQLLAYWRYAAVPENAHTTCQ